MTTVYCSVGNSDDKLGQAVWSEFHARFAAQIRFYATAIHGAWLSPGDAAWQNACMCFEVDDTDAAKLKHGLADLALEFDQDSIAWAETPETEFIGPRRAGGDD